MDIYSELNKWDGFPVGNFALAANVSQNGRLAGFIMRNPGKLHQWLEPLAKTSFRLSSAAGMVAVSEMSEVRVERAWPFAHVVGQHPDNPDLTFAFEIFCPVQEDSEFVSAMPCLLVSLRLQNEGAETAVTNITWSLDELEQDSAPILAFAQDGRRQIREGGVETAVTLLPNTSQTICFVLAAYDPDGAAARHFTDATDIANYVLDNWERLRDVTQRLEQHIPTTGIAELDEALRWYMGSGVYLTRCTRQGAVLTMGYEDLNQRDSYWTSWLHLVLWPSLERRMIEASAAAVQSDGKVPTCILAQVYERADDLDINAYFVLRVLRYINTHDDWEFGYRLWPALMMALRWLMARAPDGLPVQGTFWGDWKDVAGIEGRKYSPHASLLYIAALERTLKLGEQLQKTADCAELTPAYQRAITTLNKHPREGGLWDGRCYVQVWHDGRVDTKVLQDQCVGILFGVVDEEKTNTILQTLADNRCQYGVCETWPYYPESFGYAPGAYHNGGVWPYLTFVDAWVRLIAGQRDEAIAIIRDTAHTDLIAQGDWQPHEYIHAETGENCGRPLQAWNACLFGTLFFGFPRLVVP